MSLKAAAYPLRPWRFARSCTCQGYQLSMLISIKRHRSHHTAIPRLVAEAPDGTLEDILEEDLYRYKRNRWIYNESVQLGQRYLKFDLLQLLKVAVSALSEGGARHCTRVLKCREGLNSKAYLLTMDNGSEVIAKLPNPIAGPAYYTTASEVATREFLRDALSIPVPQIIAWSADRNNPVGAEYILEEKAPGTPLGRLWYQWPMKSRLEVVSQVVKIERKLASTTFSKCGCIYFRGGANGNESSSGSSAFTTNPPLPSSILERFSLGPLVSSGMWRGDRAGMDMHRGPYSGPLEYVQAMATNEIKFVKAHARPRMNYHRSLTEPESPEELLTLLNYYLDLAPAMVPPRGLEDTYSPTLWHPDLHLDNIFVDPGSRKITQIIDWQSAAIMPFFYQCGIPRMFKNPGGIPNDLKMPELPDNYNVLDHDEKEKVNSARNSEICHKYYIVETMDHNPRHWDTLQLENLHVRTEPARLVVNVWEDQDVFFLRRALLSIAEQWQELFDSGPCPITFSDEEIKIHAAEEESLKNVSEILCMFQDKWGLPANGMVNPGAFMETRDAVAEMRDLFLRSADNEAERELFSKIWPYREPDT